MADKICPKCRAGVLEPIYQMGSAKPIGERCTNEVCDAPPANCPTCNKPAQATKAYMGGFGYVCPDGHRFASSVK